MIATVRLGPVELAALLKDYCESLGHTYFDHGITEDDLVELHMELSKRPAVQYVPVRTEPPAQEPAVPATTYVAPVPPTVSEPQLSLDLTTIMDPASTPDGTARAQGTDDALAEMFRKKLPPESQRVNPPIVHNPADDKSPI